MNSTYLSKQIYNSWAEWSESINEDIIKYKLYHNMSQEQYAQLLGISSSIIESIEKKRIKYVPQAADIIIQRLYGKINKNDNRQDSWAFVYSSSLTNFRYRLSRPLTNEQVDQINSMLDSKGHADIQSRVRAIIAAGSSLEFDSINPNKKGEYLFYENLILIDSSLPEIIARLLVMSYTENTRLLDELTEKMSAENPLKFPMRANKKYYEAKVKRFVTDVALGMLPSQPWEATHQSSGVLVVTETGDIDCYHVIYKASLDDYLYHDLKFETPSASRHGFGSIETDKNGTQYFSLNLQLRFLK